MQIGDTFERSVTRPIPPVVYFHEQGDHELQREVEEYIITGGYPSAHPRATADGIHEQFVRLLGHMKTELEKPGGPELPACWISGFYGSGANRGAGNDNRARWTTPGFQKDKWERGPLMPR